MRMKHNQDEMLSGTRQDKTCELVVLDEDERNVRTDQKSYANISLDLLHIVRGCCGVSNDKFINNI